MLDRTTVSYGQKAIHFPAVTKTLILWHLDNVSFCVRSLHVLDKAQEVKEGRSYGYNRSIVKQSEHKRNDKSNSGQN
jgi:hypothetical protein